MTRAYLLDTLASIPMSDNNFVKASDMEAGRCYADQDGKFLILSKKLASRLAHADITFKALDCKLCKLETITCPGYHKLGALVK